MSADPRLIKEYLAMLLKSLDEANSHPPCLRGDGSLRAWFSTVESALDFQKRFPETYGADVITLCSKCGGRFHLSSPDWLPFLPWETEVSKLKVN